MTATNNDDMLEKLDSAAHQIRRALLILEDGHDGPDDTDLCKCCMAHAEIALNKALVDLIAAKQHGEENEH